MTKTEQVKVIAFLEEADGRLRNLKTRVLNGTISADSICTFIESIQRDLDGHIETVTFNEVGVE